MWDSVNWKLNKIRTIKIQFFEILGISLSGSYICVVFYKLRALLKKKWFSEFVSLFSIRSVPSFRRPTNNKCFALYEWCVFEFSWHVICIIITHGESCFTYRVLRWREIMMSFRLPSPRCYYMCAGTLNACSYRPARFPDPEHGTYILLYYVGHGGYAMNRYDNRGAVSLGRVPNRRTHVSACIPRTKLNNSDPLFWSTRRHDDCVETRLCSTFDGEMTISVE